MQIVEIKFCVLVIIVEQNVKKNFLNFIFYKIITIKLWLLTTNFLLQVKVFEIELLCNF